MKRRTAVTAAERLDIAKMNVASERRIWRKERRKSLRLPAVEKFKPPGEVMDKGKNHVIDLNLDRDEREKKSTSSALARAGEEYTSESGWPGEDEGCKTREVAVKMQMRQ